MVSSSLLGVCCKSGKSGCTEAGYVLASGFSSRGERKAERNVVSKINNGCWKKIGELAARSCRFDLVSKVRSLRGTMSSESPHTHPQARNSLQYIVQAAC